MLGNCQRKRHRYFCLYRAPFNDRRFAVKLYYQIVEVENPDNFESQGTFSQVKWSRSEVLFLLSLYKEREHRFKDKKSKKKTLWEEIAREMREQGYDYTGPQCETKFKNLKQGYTKTVDHNNKSGNDKKTCPYFEELSHIFVMTPCVTPVALCSNINTFPGLSLCGSIFFQIFVPASKKI